MRTYNNRRGLGKGLGVGYYNITPMDSHVHSLSAKGVKTWKKVSDTKFVNKKKEGTLYIGKSLFTGKPEVNVEIDTILIRGVKFPQTHIHEEFSTKKQAETFANKYMKTGDYKKSLNAKRTSLDERLGHIAVTGGFLTGMKLADDVIKGEPIEKIKENKRIMEEGFSALASLTEVSHAVSTQKRFREFAEKHGYDAIESSVNRDDWNKARPFFYNGKNYFPYQEFKQSGYGAYHIGSTLEELKSKGRTPLIVDGNRNMRFVFATADPKVNK